MKFGIKIFTCAVIAATIFWGGWADAAPVELSCIEKIGTDPDFTKKLTELFDKDDGNLSDLHIKANNKELYELIASLFFKHCQNYTEWNAVADADNMAFGFDFKNQKYHITLNTDTLFELHPIQTALLFVPIHMKNMSIGDIVTNNSVPKDFFPKECSVHNRYNTNKETPIDIIGKEVFSSSVALRKGEKVDFFITSRDHLGIFKGIISYRITLSTGTIQDSEPLVFNNYQEARRKLNLFASKLSDTPCAGLVLFHVSPHTNNIYEQLPRTSLTKKRDNMRILSEPFVIGNSGQ